MISIESDTVGIVFNPEGGHLDEVVFRHGGQELRPMHRAPWRGPVGDSATSEPLPDSVPTVERNLAGDFFCAPFCANDVTGGRIHGQPASGHWNEARRDALPGGGTTVVFELAPSVMDARLRKEITLLPGHPVVYQRHVFSGGEGSLPLAHHAMLHVPGGAALSFSPKDFGGTTTTPVESDPSRGRSIVMYPQRFESLAAVSLAAGGTADITRYPFAERHEDVLFLVERKGARHGWSAALAADEGFLFFGVKDARVLPQTVLWLSNGGRDYAPWLGRHRAVIGIEEACTFYHDGHRASIEPNALTREGYRTAIDLVPGGEVSIRYAFGAVPAPQRWTRVASVALQGDGLRIAETGGAEIDVAFDTQRI